MNKKSLVSLILPSLLSGCASLPENTGRTESHAFTDTQNTLLGKKVQEYRNQGKTEDGFVLLSSGLDAFVARAALAESAERSLDVQYYLYHNDLVGKLFTGFLWKAAQRGVRVRLLIDDMGMEGRDEGIITLDSHTNIELRIFNPFDRDIGRGAQFVTGLGSVTRRMHNKSFTADNVVTIVGGRNIGNEYYDADPTLEFADLDVMVIGDVVKEVSKSFDAYWSSSLAYPATTIIKQRPSQQELLQEEENLIAFMEEQQTSNYMTALLNSELSQKIRDNSLTYIWGDATVVVDHAEKLSSSRDANELHLMTQLAPYFESIEKELIIISPYFVPGDEGVAFFKSLTDKGIRVKILTNSLSSNDVGIVHAGYSKYRKALLRNGVELYEVNKKLTRAQRKEKKGIGSSSKASLHAKVFVLDRKQVFIGSLNLDPRSFYENSEIGLVIDSSEMAQDMAEGFDADIEKQSFTLELKKDEDGYEELLWHGYENGDPVTFDVDPYTSFWRRFGVGFMGLLPIESQL
ncbi:MAG: phospholipase D family protein [Gammaproteobacteria bacterium]